MSIDIIRLARFCRGDQTIFSCSKTAVSSRYMRPNPHTVALAIATRKHPSLGSISSQLPRESINSWLCNATLPQSQHLIVLSFPYPLSCCLAIILDSLPSGYSSITLPVAFSCSHLSSDSSSFAPVSLPPLSSKLIPFFFFELLFLPSHP